MTDKLRYLFLFGWMIAMGCWAWMIANGQGAFRVWSVPMETVQGVRDPVFLKTEHGTFNLSVPPRSLTELPAEYRALKSLLDSDGCILHLVHFERAVSDADESAVIAMGGNPCGYLPGNVLIVSAPPELATVLSATKGVSEVAERPPWMSLDPYLMKSFKGKRADQMVKVVVNGRNFETVLPILKEFGIPHVQGESPTVVCAKLKELKARIIPLLLSHPGIAYIGPYSKVRVM